MGSIKAQNLKIPERISAAKRRQFVLQLKKADATYRQIAEATIRHFGIENLPKNYDERYAYDDVQIELKRVRDQVTHIAAEVRDLELQRISEMISKLYPKALGQAGRGRPDDSDFVPERPPDYKAIDRIIKLMERRAKLLGLDEPEKFDFGDKPIPVKVLAGASMNDI